MNTKSLMAAVVIFGGLMGPCANWAFNGAYAPGADGCQDYGMALPWGSRSCVG